MIGSFATRGITMILGYIYPAYECFKAIEQRRPNLEILRFWCQYWVIMALLTVLERFGDTFISWVPLYCEAKLAFIIYLWYSKPNGTTYIYTSFVRPFLISREPEIEQHLNELRTRAIDYVALHWQKGASFAQVKFFDILQYVAAQANRPAPPPPPPPPAAPPPNNFQQPPPPSAPAYNIPPPSAPQAPPAPEGFYPPPPPPPPPFEASAPPVTAAAMNPVFRPPPPTTPQDAGYRPGFYPTIQQQVPQPRLPFREQIDLEEDEEEDEEVLIRPAVDRPGLTATTTSTSSTSRYMTRSRQRASSTASSGDRRW